jgi:hypothetical protein
MLTKKGKITHYMQLFHQKRKKSFQHPTLMESKTIRVKS